MLVTVRVYFQGAINIWNKDELLQKFLSNPSHPSEGDRNIFIFHCEFSSKRGPDMSRFLRKMDRQKNDMGFPKLYHPEMYLAHGGYKSFYEQFPVSKQFCCGITGVMLLYRTIVFRRIIVA